MWISLGRSVNQYKNNEESAMERFKNAKV